MHDRDVRTEETHVGDIANKARAFHVRPQQRIVKVNELVAPAEARAIEGDEIRIIGERRRNVSALPRFHPSIIATYNARSCLASRCVASLLPP